LYTFLPAKFGEQIGNSETVASSGCKQLEEIKLHLYK